MPEASISFDADAVFTQLADTVRSSFIEAPGIAAASLRTTLAHELPAFAEMQQAMGYRKFLDFLVAAEERQLVRVTRVGESLHPYVSPWDESQAAPVAALKSPVAGYRVRGTVWPALVDWDQTYARMWDREANRAFMFPTIDGEPAWSQTPSRFAAIEPVSPETQFGWMREFAETLTDDQRQQVLPTIGESAPRGAFRSTLRALRIERQWTATLQQRVAEYAREWGRMNDVGVSHLLEPDRPPTKRAETSKSPLGGRASTVDARSVATRRQPTEEFAETLRARLHLVIDQMTVAELSALSVPAAYLIQA